jgi:hypothetical protein
MPLTVHVSDGTYSFNGPFTDTEDLDRKSGVYVISTKEGDGKHKVLDVGESDDIRSRIDNHDRKECWSRHKLNGIYVSAYYCGESRRMTVEAEVRSAQKPSCGKR